MRAIKKIAIALLAIIAILFALALASCATPNQNRAEKHFKKFIYYGGAVQNTTDTLRVPIIVKGKDGKDSTVYLTEYVECPEVTFPVSKTETRQKERTKRMEVKAETKQVVADIRAEVKIAKCWGLLQKIGFGMSFFVVGLVFGFILKMVVKI